MHVLSVRNVHQALPEGIRYLRYNGVRRDSRNGPVVLATVPVTTVYQKPCERVLFWPERDANPFFHLFESLWMLAGRNDVEYVARFVKRMRTFSDDGQTLHGAYGHRWLKHFGVDQVHTIVNELRDNPDSRRCVLAMWDAPVDLGRQGKDLPCNTQAYFTRDTEGRLDMTVCNRSNDIVWGAYGANAVHFSVLQEYMAAAIGCPVGYYWQMTNNYHAYLDTFEPLVGLIDQTKWTSTTMADCPYERGKVVPSPLVTKDIETWRRDLNMFLTRDTQAIGYRDKFFRRTALPMYTAWCLYKVAQGQKNLLAYDDAVEVIETQCKSEDWQLACKDWLLRRRNSAQRRAEEETE